MLLDGQRTGHFRWDQLSKTEKTHCGTLVEINLQRELQLADGAVLDFAIEGVDVDCKYSQELYGWMLPPEAVGQLCLGLWASDQEGVWSAGLFRPVEAGLRSPRGNRDRKRQLAASARSSVRWLHWQKPLPDNVLLRLPPEDISAIFAPRDGTKRVDELFRRAQRRLVSRTVVATVAKQEDYMKRVRGNGGSRSSLRPEGIVIFGQNSLHSGMAEALGLPVPGKGEFVSVRLTQAGARHAGLPSVEIDGTQWAVAQPEDPAGPAPLLPLPRGRG